ASSAIAVVAFSSQKSGSIVGSAKALFVGGKKLTLSKLGSAPSGSRSFGTVLRGDFGFDPLGLGTILCITKGSAPGSRDQGAAAPGRVQGAAPLAGVEKKSIQHGIDVYKCFLYLTEGVQVVKVVVSKGDAYNESQQIKWVGVTSEEAKFKKMLVSESDNRIQVEETVGPDTIAEAINTGLPIILNDYIPGQVGWLTKGEDGQVRGQEREEISDIAIPVCKNDQSFKHGHYHVGA
ncbi:hypothetical protein Tco_0558571, partial [Tanacetum coccineum]